MFLRLETVLFDLFLALFVLLEIHESREKKVISSALRFLLQRSECLHTHGLRLVLNLLVCCRDSGDLVAFLEVHGCRGCFGFSWKIVRF